MSEENAVTEEPAAEPVKEAVTEEVGEDQLKAVLEEAIAKGDDDEKPKETTLKIGLNDKDEIVEVPKDTDETKTEETPADETEDKGLNEEEMLKRSGLGDFKTLAEFAKSHKDQQDKYAGELEPLHWAQKHAPHILSELYTKIGRAIVGDKGLPEVKSPLEGRINPNTEQPYTAQEIQQAEDFFGAMASKQGFVKATDMDERDKANRFKEDLKAAALNTKQMEKTWKSRVEAIGLKWDSDILPGISQYLAGFGIRDSNPELITPENLANALNSVLLKHPDAMSMIVENAKAAGAKESEQKRGQGKALPTGAVKVHEDAGDFMKRFESLPVEKQGKLVLQMIRQAGGKVSVPDL